MSRNVKDLEAGTAKRLGWLQTWCDAAGIGIIVTCTLRTSAEQDALYAQGRTRPGKIVTNAKGGQSWHNVGRAFDICFSDGKRVSYSGPWARVAAKARELGLTWGGDFESIKDKPHFQFEFDGAGVTHPLAYYAKEKKA